jgi:hypothetical protein
LKHFFNEQPCHRQVDRPDSNQPPSSLAREGLEAFGLISAIGLQNQGQKLSFLGLQLFLFFDISKVGVNPDEMLTLILTKIKNLKCSIALPFSYELPLHTDHPLARGMDSKLAQVTGNPLTAKLFSYGSRRS